MQKRRYVLVCLFLFVSGLLHANNFYIDHVASGTDSGESWANAWTSFDQINWNLFQAGDTLFISGGQQSKTYSNSTLYIHYVKQATEDAPIVITKGKRFPHAGDVIFEGNSIHPYGIHIDRSNFFKIEHLTLNNFVETGCIHIRWSKGITVDHCSIRVGGHGGIYSHACTYLNVFNCSITTPVSTNRQNDGIYSQWGNHQVFANNTIIINNQDIEQHCDAIQCEIDTNITFCNNYIEQSNNKKYNCQGLFASNCSGDIVFYNNIVYAPNSENILIGIQNDGVERNGRMLAFHNTLYGGKWGTIKVMNAPNSIVKNNIVINYFNPAWAFRLEGAINFPSNIDYNIYYTPNSDISVSVNLAHKTWEYWKSLGFEKHGMLADPQLEDVTNRNFHILPTSPAFGTGTTLPALFKVDYYGFLRTEGNIDMGALQSGSHMELVSPENLRFSQP